ncbi:hypothetical protein [Pseudomonas fluorescens]|uniref:Hemopexin n=1 Tax=Pseudomonas fluorescens TaxID=294 RepID=A0A5E7PAF5_PSEFL|nr:hypothetical protein [Pseudomonas fluorescens]VVP45958.1 hypothetical protein PS880_05097 [Pseudomonas fluorescens]
MPTLKNFVTVDWRSGADAIHFFFKDTNQYSRFNTGDNEVPKGYPREITIDRWDSFHSFAKKLRFGFTTTDMPGEITGFDSDVSWLFFYEDDMPAVCKYDQDADKVSYTKFVKDTVWAPLLPYFDRIVAGTWLDLIGKSFVFKFIMSDGNHFIFDYKKSLLNYPAISPTSWNGLERFNNRVITGVQKDRTFADNYFYIFLTDSQYLIYNLQLNSVQSGPHAVNDVNWPGLLRD